MVTSSEPKVPCTPEALKPLMARHARKLPTRILLPEYMSLLDGAAARAARTSDSRLGRHSAICLRVCLAQTRASACRAPRTRRRTRPSPRRAAWASASTPPTRSRSSSSPRRSATATASRSTRRCVSHLLSSHAPQPPHLTLQHTRHAHPVACGPQSFHTPTPHMCAPLPQRDDAVALSAASLRGVALECVARVDKCTARADTHTGGRGHAGCGPPTTDSSAADNVMGSNMRAQATPTRLTPHASTATLQVRVQAAPPAAA